MRNLQFLTGRLTKGAEIRHFDGQRSKASFGLAVNKSYTNDAGQRITATQFHDVVSWSPRLLEIVEKYCAKGKQVIVKGESTKRSYEKEGITRYVYETKVLDILPVDQMIAEEAFMQVDMIAGVLAEKPVLATDEAGEKSCTLLFKRGTFDFPVLLKGAKAQLAHDYLQQGSPVAVQYDIKSIDPFQAVGVDLTFLGSNPSGQEGEPRRAGASRSEGNKELLNAPSEEGIDELPF